MTTDPEGAVFVSYRRTYQRMAEAVLVVNALRDRGIPTWRDLDDLRTEPTEEELIRVLTDPGLAGAVLLIAPEVASSTMIRNVEAPRIFNRHRMDDGFAAHPVLVGLDYHQANDVLNAPAGFKDLGDWNLHKIGGDKLLADDARMIARSVLKRRLCARKDAQPHDPLEVGLFSRRSAGARKFSLRLNFEPHFDGRTPKPASFETIECALRDSAGVVTDVYGECELSCSGNASLPLGVLFGSIFSPLAGFRLSWSQGIAEGKPEQWSLLRAKSAMEGRISHDLGDLNSNDIVLAIGTSANIRPAVAAFIREFGLTPRVSLYCEPPNGPLGQGEALSAEDGLALALQAIDAARAAKDDLMMERATLHVFLACPLALAVLIGQKLNTFSNCVLYEHFPDRSPVYGKVHSFQPSS